MKIFSISILALALTGCATPPNTPGAGSGKTYTPVVDMQGLDMTRYSKDLDECRQYSGIIDAGKATMQGAIGGIILGALLGAAVGHQHGMSNFGANYGATLGGGAGMGAAGNKAIGQQERIMVNCMAGRGYRTLDANAMPNPNYTSPYTQGATASLVSPVQQGQQISTGYAIPQELQQPAVVKTTFKPGKDLYQAEQFAKSNACALPVQPGPSGPGFENYSAGCTNGDTLMMRCEFGNCRALR